MSDFKLETSLLSSLNSVAISEDELVDDMSFANNVDMLLGGAVTVGLTIGVETSKKLSLLPIPGTAVPPEVSNIPAEDTKEALTVPSEVRFTIDPLDAASSEIADTSVVLFESPLVPPLKKVETNKSSEVSLTITLRIFCS
jgi:hypothetical protein